MSSSQQYPLNLVNNVEYIVVFTAAFKSEYFFNIVYQAEMSRSLIGGEEGQPQQFLVRVTFSSFSRPSHLEILVSNPPRFVKNQATIGHK